MRDSPSPAAIHALAALDALAGLDASALAAVARVAVRHTYEPRQVVLMAGQPGAGLYLVEEGWLRAAKVSAAGREQVVRFVGPGEAANEIGLFVAAESPVTITALEPTVLWLIPRQAMLQLLDEHRGLAQAVTQNLARRVLHLSGLVEDLSLHPVEARVARFLISESVDGVLQRRRWATQPELAARLGTVPDVLNRALRTLTNEGLIAVDRQRIRILHPDRLRERAQGCD